MTQSDLEYHLLREFKRKAHHYDEPLPQDQATLEWLALMRHFSVPTRLLDCTYSFFVGLFFATELSLDGNDSPSCPALWAINDQELGARVQSRYPPSLISRLRSFEKGVSMYDERLFCEPRRFVYAVNPYRLNERLILQQGVFLWPGNAAVSFMRNLEDIIREDLSNARFVRKYKLNIDLDTRREWLYHLHRMNISRATLFLGLDGFAQSLATKVALQEASSRPPQAACGEERSEKKKPQDEGATDR